FFGRTELAGRLVEAVEDRPGVLVLGHSGSGKSSLVRAGLLPAFRRRRPAGLLVELQRSSAAPVNALAAAFGAAGLALSASSLPDEIVATVRAADVSILVLIDHLDALWRTSADKRGIIELLDLLGELATSQGSIRIVCTLRSD